MSEDEDRLDKLMGRKENEELNRILGKKGEKSEGKGKKIKCPKCGHEFVEG